ncbi:MAG: type II toxin-antitoxin system Phd/YefM family antitoxin [Anaerolineae bacterium]|nr:type II toxin-antitoxin system Phd/YefM family antitoxin [Anaerolineae bacterium]
MTLTLSVTDASINLAQLLKRARHGEDIIIVEGEKPVARFVLLDKSNIKRMPGTAKGQITIAEDFDAPLPEFVQESFEA